MIRIATWSGLLTAASPYVIPPGSSSVQVNAHSALPGQLTVRKGMTAVTYECDSDGCTLDLVDGGLLEIWAASPGSGGTDKIFGLATDGEIVILTVPTAFP